MAKILLAEDEHDLARLIRDWLAHELHIVEVVNNGLDALHYLKTSTYDVVILDLMLPGMDGLEICRQFRTQRGSTPVLMLTARSSIEDKESGFDVGADDYLTKPFHLKELSARVKALLRRPQNIRQSLQIGNIVVNSNSCTVTRAGVAIHLLPQEFRLLELLVRHPNQVFSSEALLSRVWGSDTMASLDTVRGHINRLRKKLDVHDRPSIITTVRGIGYKLEAT